MKKLFKCEYTVDDGYCTGSRPQFFYIDKSEIEDDMNKEELKSLFDNQMQDDFLRETCPCAGNVEEFIEWGLKIIREKSQ